MRIYPSDPDHHQAVLRSQSLILLQTVDAFAPFLAQDKAYTTPEGAFVRRKEQLYDEFWRTPSFGAKRSSVFPSDCEVAQIGFFKCGASSRRSTPFFSEEWLKI